MISRAVRTGVRAVVAAGLLSAAFCYGHAQRAVAARDALREGFENPPQDAKLRTYWWWMNGYTTTETITRDLTELKARHYAGVLLVDGYDASDNIPQGPDFGSPAWMKLYLHTLKTAADLGMEVSLTITNGGNVGILGDDGVKPAEALKVMTFSHVVVDGGHRVSVKLPMPMARNGFYAPIAVLAYPLRHGAALAGEKGSARAGLGAMKVLTAADQAGDSMTPPEEMFPEETSTPGEQDADVKQVVDVSARMSADGTLTWEAPAGAWEILRVGCTDNKVFTDPGPGRHGLGLDVLSSAAFDRYWDRVVVPVLDASKPYVGKSLKYVVTDSWEASGMNWTDDFRREFTRRRGYDPLPYLPIVYGRMLNSRETSLRFLADLRRTVGDLLAENYYDHFAQRAAAYGLGTHPEAGGPHTSPMDALRNFRASAFPQTEFWAASTYHRIHDEDRFFVKEASSAAHIYGKRYVAAESFSRMGDPWDVPPATNLKPTFDRALTEGLNRIYWHQFTSSPVSAGRPGLEYFADTHLDPNVTWWNQAAPVTMAMNRAQFLLQQGEPVVDVLYYYGTQVPGFVRLKQDDPAHVLPGYDYDVIDEDALLRRMIVANGDLHTPEGIHYRALVLPHSRRIALEDLRWLETYVRAGGTVVGLKPLSPEGLVSAQQTAEFERIASRMWDACKEGGQASYARGRVFCTQNGRAALEAMHVSPDFSYKANEPNAALDYVHRRSGSAEIYFVRNAKDAPVEATLTFRVRGREPEWWNIDSGELRSAAVYRESDVGTDVPLSLPAYGSVFVIFRKPASKHAIRITRDGREIFPSAIAGEGLYSDFPAHALEIERPGAYEVTRSTGEAQRIVVADASERPSFVGPWTLTFPPGLGAPPFVKLDGLHSWTESTISGVRYFSGTATYSATLQVPVDLLQQHREIWMDLGDVREVATVIVNGKTLDTLWHGPFRSRIDSQLHSGANSVEVRVTNLWPNRLIGDAQPGSKHFAQTNIEFYKKDSPLLPSGLLSAVSFSVIEKAPLR